LLKLTLIFFVLTFLTSCDCYRRISGTVLDNKTGKSIQGVTVYSKNKNWVRTTTDSIGHFELSDVSGGFSCPPMEIILEARGYNPTETSIAAGGSKTIKMSGKAHEGNKTLQLMQGHWVHDEDSLATLTILKNQWTFNYASQQNMRDDKYSILISDKLPEYLKDTENGEFLILTNRTDTLQYEILGLTDTTFSLMYFPSGKIHIYRRHNE
jgi:hypothetical protein